MKVIDYIKKNYIVCMIIIAIILIVIGSLVIIKLLVIDDNKIESKTKKVQYYEYFETQKQDLNTKLTYENDKIVSIKCQDCNIYENGFLYYQDKMKITIPKDMSIIFYYQNSLGYKLEKYSEIENNDGTNIIYTGGKKYLNDDFFLFDGNDLYFFINDVILSVNGQKYDLSKYSYVSARTDKVIYYDYNLDQVKEIANVTSASIKVGNIDIDLLKDVTVENNKRIILSNKVDYLPIYKEN